jgi:hypothetical protein
MNKHFLGLITLVLLGIGVGGHAQNMVPKKCYLHLIGTVNKEYPVEMNLVKISDTIYGDYLFLIPGKNPAGMENTGKGIPLYGKMNSADGFVLKELASLTGSSFQGKFTGSQTLSGSFESQKSGKLSFEVTEKYPEGSIGMDVFYIKGSTPIVKKPKSPAATIQLGLLLPAESANPLISDSLSHLILVNFSGKPVRMMQPMKVLDGMRQVYFETYIGTNEVIYKESMGSSFNWQSMKFMHILMNDSHVLSFYIDHYAFTGGAHGLQTREYTSVNLWTGKEIGLRDIFKENSESRLSSILGDKVHELNHLPTTQSLKDAGYFTDTIKPTGNFYITHTGIGFYYNQYDIAPYTAGPIDVFVPFTELKDLLNKGGGIREIVR